MKFYRMKRKKRKISEDDNCQSDNRAELEDMVGVQSFPRINEKRNHRLQLVQNVTSAY